VLQIFPHSTNDVHPHSLEMFIGFQTLKKLADKWFLWLDLLFQDIRYHLGSSWIPFILNPSWIPFTLNPQVIPTADGPEIVDPTPQVIPTADGPEIVDPT